MPAMPLPLLPDGTRAALAYLLAAAALLSSARRVLAHRQCSVRARAPGRQDAASVPQQSPAHALQLRIRAVGASWRRDRPATPSARGPKPEICYQRHPLRMISVRDSVCCARHSRLQGRRRAYWWDANLIWDEMASMSRLQKPPTCWRSAALRASATQEAPSQPV